MPMTNQQQQFMAQTPPMFGSSAGNVGTLKRQLDGGDGGNAEDKVIKWKGEFEYLIVI
jgi:hypothetical protein